MVPTNNRTGQDRVVGALQPGYLPWLGFFDQVYHADLFILYDDLPYTRKSWRNRNRIKGPEGPEWLTVPVHARVGQRINLVRIDTGQDWQRSHWKRIEHCYRRAPYFDRYREAFREVFTMAWASLCDLDVHLIRLLLGLLGIETPLLLASEIDLEKNFLDTGPVNEIPTRRIVHMMEQLGARRFLEGQAGRQYLNLEVLAEGGITVCFQDYRHEPYPQLFGEFVPFLSAVDLLFNCGSRSLKTLVNPCLFDQNLKCRAMGAP